MIICLKWIKKLFCPLYRSLSGYVQSCSNCPQIRYGTIGTVNSQPINKFWCGVGGKPDFMEID